jgi:hypothetical protein
MTKIKNKTYQSIPLEINGKTIILPGRASTDVDAVTSQMLALKARGMLQIVQK